MAKSCLGESLVWQSKRQRVIKRMCVENEKIMQGKNCRGFHPRVRLILKIDMKLRDWHFTWC